jgi:TrmH family RNA methyltransferase
VITSASNPKLRLVHRLLESRRQRAKEGLFVAEGEDLVQAADDAGIEPVELLRAGEDVEAGLLAKLSTMAHPPRVMGIYRSEALPRGVEPLSLALRQSRHDPAHRGRVWRLGRSLPGLCRSDRAEGVAGLGRSGLPRADRGF